MQRRVRKLYLDWNCLRYVFLWVEGKIPFVQIHSSWSHEVGAVPEDEIPIFLFLKDESEVSFATENLLHLPPE